MQQQQKNESMFTLSGTAITFKAEAELVTELNETDNFPYIAAHEQHGITTYHIALGAALVWALDQAGLSRGVLIAPALHHTLFEDGPNEDVRAVPAQDLAELGEPARDFMAKLQACLVAEHEQARAKLRTDSYTSRDMFLGVRQGDAIMHQTDNGEMPCVVTDIEARSTFFGVQLVLKAAYLGVRNNGCVSWYRGGVSMGEKERITRKNASVVLMTDEERQHAQERGKTYLGLSRNALYARCDGALRVQRGWNVMEMPLHGRVIVDPLGSAQTVPRIAGGDNAFGPDYTSHPLPVELQDCVCFFPQFAQGFSFTHKTWGLLSLDELSDIAFRDQAFDQLVLDEQVKKTVYSLVKHSENSFSDIIDGKSGGSIFLLYGPPGAGKTLTAEAVAETQHRPLYVVNVGELGTTPDELEKALKAALQTAERWNAVVLLDEADIFLERRTPQDVVRNALVGIFLRELEYYRGVMFLTTNRASNLDPAILSRVSLGIRYDALDEQERLQVWKTLTRAALGGADADFKLDEFAQLPLNGRQIKNALRQAITLGKSQDLGLTRDNLHLSTSMTVQFMQDCQPKHFE